MPTESGCNLKLYPGLLLRYTREGSTRKGCIYLVAVRCRGKGKGITPDTCTFPVLIDLKTGYAKKGTSTPPKHMPAKDWRKHGIPAVDVFGTDRARYYETVKLQAFVPGTEGINLG